MTDSLDAEIAFIIQANKVGRHTVRIKVCRHWSTQLACLPSPPPPVKQQHRFKTRSKWGGQQGLQGQRWRRPAGGGPQGPGSTRSRCSPDTLGRCPTSASEGTSGGRAAPQEDLESLHIGNSWQIAPVIYWSGWRDASLNCRERL